MNATVALNLALILFLPWYAILAVLYWVYPRKPRGLLRAGFDLAALGLATFATVASMHWSMFTADLRYGALWPQILATSVSYGVFLAVLTLAFFLRRRLLAVHATTLPPTAKALP